MIVPDPHPARGACRSCGAAIIWTTTTKSGKPMPVDAEPTADGNVSVGVDRTVGSFRGALTATVVSQQQMFDGQLYVSHFATCPNAQEHRRR